MKTGIKLKALTYFHNSELRINVVQDEVFKTSKKYGEQLVQAGLAETANQNAKVGKGNPKDSLQRIKDARKAYLKRIDAKK